MCITFTITFVIYKYIHVYMCVWNLQTKNIQKKSITTLVSNVVKCA